MRTGCEPISPRNGPASLPRARAAVDGVHDLQRTVRAELLAACHHPAHECGGLAGVTEPHQPVEREGRIADPGVAVVPVARAADVLGQAERGRRHDRAVFSGREQLERQCGAVHYLAPAVLVGAAADPGAPEIDRFLEGLRGVVGVVAGRWLLRLRRLRRRTRPIDRRRA